MEWNTSQSEEGNLTGRSKLRRLASRLPFSIKVTIHIVIIILLTGGTITTVLTYQFQRESLRREYEQALTVYTAGVNYLVAHYFSHGKKFVDRNLDYVLGTRFMRLEDDPAHRLSMRAEHIFLYTPQQQLIYQYSREPGNLVATGSVPPASETFKEWHVPHEKLIHISGPIRSRGRIDRVRTLYPHNGD